MGQIGLENVTKEFAGGVRAVDDVSLTIGDGEFMVLVGPSGCGKTTTLRMLAGFERPTTGEIRFDGRVVNDEPPRAREIGFVFQNYALFTHMSAYDNIALGLKARGEAKAEVRLARALPQTLGEPVGMRAAVVAA